MMAYHNNIALSPVDKLGLFSGRCRGLGRIDHVFLLPPTYLDNELVQTVFMHDQQVLLGLRSK